MSYKILSVESDTKTTKGSKNGYLTAILYMAPHTIALDVLSARGYTGDLTVRGTLCAFATKGCKLDCLFFAGLAQIFPRINQARIEKTIMFLTRFEDFKALVIRDINTLVREANRRAMVPAVRLNGTTDILWERVFPEIFETFPDVQFYDYTKIPIRHRVKRPSNYHLTFSLSESNARDAIEAINLGVNVAAVFKTALLPSNFLARPVVSGDENDLRFLDERARVSDGKGFILGLYVKGNEARKHEVNGFIN